MPVFHYVALDQRGQEVRGNLEGTDPRAVANTLRGRSLYPVRLEGAAGADAGRALADRSGGTSAFDSVGKLLALIGATFRRVLPVTNRDRVFFFQQMALMLRTGLTLLQALEVAREQALKPAFARAVDRLTAAIQQGQSLSRAMKADARMFPSLAVKLIETAEASGELDRILDQVSEYLERRAELKRRLVTAMTYPAIVVLMSLGVATFLVVTIIPKFAAFFTRRQIALPWATRVLMDISDFTVQYGPATAAIAAALVAVLVVARFVPAGRMTLDRAVLSVPVVGGLLTIGAMTQLSHTLGMLLASGVTLLESLRIAGGVLNNQAIAATVRDAADQILRGRDLTHSLVHPVIPRLVTQVVAVGERTGSLSQVLDELATFYDKQLQARIQRMSALIEPLMILIVGGMVGFVYFAFFQAVFQLATGGQ